MRCVVCSGPQLTFFMSSKHVRTRHMACQSLHWSWTLPGSLSTPSFIQYMELGVSFTSLGYWWTGVWQLPHLQLSYWVHSLLLSETLRYGPRQWHVVPLVADNFAPLVVSGLVLGISGQWAFTSQFSTSNSCFWSAYVCQNVSYFPIV